MAKITELTEKPLEKMCVEVQVTSEKVLSVVTLKKGRTCKRWGRENEDVIGSLGLEL